MTVHPACRLATTHTTGSKSFKKSVTVRNYSNSARVYSVSSSFRFAADAASGAVTVNTPSTVFVPANRYRQR